MNNGMTPELESRPQGRREWSGWLTSLVLPLSFVIVLVGGLIYMQSSSGDRPESNYGTVALPDNLNPTGERPQATVGRAAPNFVLESMAGPLIHLSDLQGKPIIVSFFTTWCTGCRTQVPVLVEAARLGGDGVMVLAVNLQESSDRIDPFLAGYDVGFPVLLDRDGNVSATWQVGGQGQPLPATFFIDATGVVRKVSAGALTMADAEAGLNDIAGGAD